MNRRIPAAIFIVLALISRGPTLLGQAPEPEPDQKTIEEFATNILPNWGAPFEFHKWAASPQISCFGEAATTYKPLVAQFVSEVSSVLDGLSAKPVLIADNSPKADIIISIDTVQNLNVLRRLDKTPNTWDLHMNWNAQKSFERFVTYTDTATLARAREEHSQYSEVQLIYRLLLTSMGFNTYENKHPYRSGYSLFYFPGGRSNTLSLLDKKMIRFAYEFVPAGASKTEVRTLLRKNWELVQLPAAAMAPVAPIAPAPPKVVLPPPAIKPPSLEEIAAWAAGAISSGETGFHKWKRPFRISLFGKAVLYRTYTEHFVADVSNALRGLPAMPILGSNSSEDAEVILCLDDKWTLAADRAREHVAANAPLAVELNPDQSLRKVIIFDEASTRQPSEALAYRSLSKALGFFGGGGAGITSVWCPDSNTARYSIMDKGLIRFAYDWIPDGAKGPDVRQIVSRQWKVAQQPPAALPPAAPVLPAAVVAAAPGAALAPGAPIAPAAPVAPAGQLAADPSLPPADHPQNGANVPLPEVSMWAIRTICRPNTEFHKWNKSPTISLFGKATDYHAIAKNFTVEMCYILNGTAVQPVLIDDSSENADIKLYMENSEAELEVYRAKEHAPPKEHFSAVIDSDHSLKKCCVFAPNFPLRDQSFRATPFVYRALAMGMGLLVTDMTTPRYFYSMWCLWMPRTEAESHFTDMDRKLIRFTYDNIPDNATPDEMRALIAQKWK